MEQVILVDETDSETGVMEKMEAHEKAVLHRAFSVFIFNKNGEMLMQRRALTKYHSGGLWTNTCCSHPRPGEETITAASRRLQEELGFSTLIQKQFSFIYQADFENGLTEYEFDHVFTGYYDGPILANLEEVAEFAYWPMHKVKSLVQTQPELFTAWFHIAFPKIMDWWQQNSIS